MSVQEATTGRRPGTNASEQVGRYALYTLSVTALIVLCVSAWLNVFAVNSFGESLASTHRSVTTTRALARAVHLSALLSTPARDVFVSRAPVAEQQRLTTALASLHDAIASVRTELPASHADLRPRLDAAEQASSATAASSERVLRTVTVSDWDSAGLALRQLDDTERTMRDAFDDLSGAAAVLQDVEYAQEQLRLMNLERVRVALGASLLAFIVGSALLVRRFLSHARERRLIAAAQDRALATAEYTPDGILLSANENFLQLTGSAFEELDGRPHSALLDETTASSDDYERFWDGLRRGETHERKFARRSKSGERLWTHASYYPIQTRSGAVTKVVEYARDLTAEIRLDTSRQALAAIVDASNDAIIGKSLDGTVTSWNAAAERLFGYTAAEIVGQCDDRLLPPDGVAERVAVTARLLRGEAGSTYETRKFRKNGTSIVVSISPFAVRDDSGCVVGIGEILRDVTERLQAEAALQHVSRALHEHSIVVTTDVRGKITSVNDKFCEVTQYTRDEVIGRNYRLVNSGYHPREFWQDLWTTVKAGRIWKGEIRNARKNGSFYWVDSTIIPARDTTGTIVGFVTVRTDITERRRAAELLEQAAREAEARNEELARAHLEALAATQAKSAFLASISHEMRTPLNAIIAMADLLSESHLQAHQEDQVRRLGRASGSLLQLVNDVLDLTKLEADQLVIEAVPFDLYALLDDVSEMLALRVQEKNLGFISLVHPGVPQMVVGDQTRLRQVLLNLAGNAVKFTRHGEVTVRVAPIADASGTSRICFAVSDTGIGIPADKLTRVFESFTQVDASTTRKYGGTGLGLSISKRLVELMGGTLGVVSAPACGSTFSFDLELAASHQPAHAVPQAIANLQGRRVLIVDHQETSRLAAGALLTQAGITTIDAVDAASALAMLTGATPSGEPPAVVLIEKELPDMDGVALASVLKARAEYASLPIVIYSADPRIAFDLTLRELGVSDCFARPITRRRLLTALARALGEGTRLAVESERSQTPPVERQSTTVEMQPPTLRVLVVEDAEDNREVIAMFLRGGRYQIDLAENGAVGVERFLEGHYDLVLMDMQMPVMDGYQATAAIRHWEREHDRSPVPIVAITANAFAEDVERTLAAGCTVHMAKPIRRAELLKVLVEQTASSSDQADAARAAGDSVEKVVSIVGQPLLERGHAGGHIQPGALAREAATECVERLEQVV